MTEPRQQPLWAILWAVLVLLALGHAGWVLRGNGVAVDLFALLPQQDESAWQRAAVQRAADAGSAQVVVLLGSAEANRLPLALRQLRASLAASTPELVEQHPDPSQLQAALAAWQPQRRALLDATQVAQLQSAAAGMLAQQALARLLQPVSTGLLPWSNDPLDLASGWWQSRNPLPMLQPVQGELRLQHAGLQWSLLRFELQRPAFALDGERRLGSALDAAVAAARAAAGELDVLYAGVPLHADAAAAQAAREMSTIGLGSLLAVLLLVWLAFASLRPILLVASSLLVGCAVGLSSTVLLFGEVHVLTLVFGASLVGVAEDYGIHYFSARQARPEASAWSLLAELRPSLLLALGTSVVAYLALGVMPFPGLRQMAWFSASGLCAAFVTVMLVFPWLDRRPPRPTRFASRLRASLRRLPALSTVGGWGLTLMLLVASMPALHGLRSVDDLRQLQNSPAGLVAMQVELGRLLQLPSPAQFFLIEAEDEQTLLQREEALLERLQPLRGQHLAGWNALTDWVPSAQRQAVNRALVGPIEDAAYRAASELLDEPIAPVAPAPEWDVRSYLASPLAGLQPALQFGCSAGHCFSLVQLRGLSGAQALAPLAAAADGLPGVRWVDRSADYSALLQTYRLRMSGLLLLGFLAVAALLHGRYGRRAWRAWLPTLLAMVVSLAALSLLDMPVTLFTVLALLLLLGIGVDYGIFLLDHGDGAAWMSVALGATSTLLAFGLLGLSATPALKTFGLTLLFGIASVWLLTPLFRPSAGPRLAHSH